MRTGEAAAWRVDSVVPGVAWPGLPELDATAALALLFQLEQTQWLSPEALLERQQHQLGLLLRHARDTVPFYRERWKPLAPFSAEPALAALKDLPLLTRADLQSGYDSLHSDSVPREHGAQWESRTSGSTGFPVKVKKTALTALFWRAFALRDHAWHRRDLSGKLAAIRQGVSDGIEDNWGRATRGLARTGPVALMRIGADPARQLAWLREQQPDYLLTYPSNLAELAREAMREGSALPGLRELRTFGEALSDEQRALCREAWDLPVTDMYSADEVGYIALQCPDHDHYHVQSEGVLVEVLRDDGSECAPGETGRVVVTALHNFATPLVRYDIGDRAEAGPPCACGRGLPVLSRILGRVRNMLLTPSGERIWPTLSSRSIAAIAPFRQYQLAQVSRTGIELRLVVDARLDEATEQRLRAHLLSRLPAGLALRIAYVDALPRSVGGKFEDFVSELPAA